MNLYEMDMFEQEEVIDDVFSYHAHDVAVLVSEEIPQLEFSHNTCHKCENDAVSLN